MMDFSKAYDRKEFVAFLQNEFLPEDVSFTDDPEAEVQQGTKYIKTISKLGTCPSLKLAVYEARHTSTNDARVGLSKDIFRFMANKRERKALVLFVPDGNAANYRFSLISIELNETETGSIKRTYSNPRRFSYYLGKDIAARTPKDYLIKKKRVLNEADLVSRFSVEILNDDFFTKYKAQYKIFCDFLQKDPEMCRSFIGFADSGKAIRDYVKKMLGRIVFLYFVQRKGWLNSDYRYMSNMFANASDAIKADFLDSVLEPMFFGLLNTPKDERIANAKKNNWDFSLIPGWENIPYLNGGLFEQDEIDKCKSVFPKEYFADLFDFFDTYNFTIDENDPDDNEVGIDPEMLGHIFENLLEDNKNKGAFYTPKEIVQYMCRESVIQYLKTHEPDEQYAEAIEHLIRDGEVDRVLQDKATAVQFTKWLSEVKVCDPAIGSGAFPMGVLNVLYHSRQLLYGFTRVNNVFSPAEVKREIIQNNIYGVDIEQGAVDIARLRFWLSLVVDETEPQPLPNLDYKIMQGNSLLESFMGYDLSRILPVNKDGKTSKRATQQASTDDAQGRIVFSDEQDSLADIQRLMRLYYSPENHKIKEELKKEIDRRVKEHIIICSGNTPSVIDAVENIEDNNKPFFLWHLYFAEVFQNGGFDIIIANPPYGAKLTSEEKTLYKKLYSDVHMRTPETFCYFISLACKLALPRNGIITYIVPNNLLFQNENAKTRELLALNNRLARAINLGDNTFENADVPTCIFTTTTGKAKCDYEINYSDYRTYNVKNIDWWERIENLNIELLRTVPSLVIGLSNKDIDIMNAIRQNGVSIDSIAEEMASGISTGGDKVFRISKQLAQDLLFEEEPLQKVLLGSEIDKYSILDTQHVLIYSTKQTNIPQYHHIYEYLKPFEQKLSQKRETRKGTLPWWCLHWPRYSQLFTEPKIIMRQTSDSIRCVYDENGYFTLNSILVFKKNTEQFDYKYIAAVLNSKITDYLYKNLTQEEGRTFAEVKPANVRKLYIPIATPKEQQLLANLYDYMCFLRDRDLPNIHEIVGNDFVGDYFQEIIDGCVYELFFSKHMTEQKIDIIQFVYDYIRPISGLSYEAQYKIIKESFTSIKMTNNPIRSRLMEFVTKSPDYLKPIIQH